MSRLFRQDQLTAWNTMRATFASWHDRVLGALLPVAALAVVCAGLANRPWTDAAWAALAACTVIGMGAGRLVAMRLAFHAFDGLLAADALHPRTRRAYIASLHGVGLALLTGVVLIGRPSLLIVSVPGYLVGVLLAWLADDIRIPKGLFDTARTGWWLQTWLHRPIAGIAAALVLLLSLLPARTFGASALLVFIGIMTVLLALLLTRVDDAIVSFMTIAGHGSRFIIVRHVKGLASFLAVVIPGSWVVLGPIAAGVAAASGAAMLLFQTLRIFAYRLLARRFADLLVSILAGLLMLMAFLMPVALPVIVLAILWQLQRLGRAKTWLLA